jgi:cytochrome c
MKRTTDRFAVGLLLGMAATGAAHAGGDPARGADLFRQNCAACHSQEPGQNLIGPSLYSVVGRPAASLTDFSYSNAMKHSGVIWTEDQLMGYLKAPRRFMPGVKMMFPGIDDEHERENVVAYLVTLREQAPANLSSAELPAPKATNVSN